MYPFLIQLSFGWGDQHECEYCHTPYIIEWKTFDNGAVVGINQHYRSVFYCSPTCAYLHREDMRRGEERKKQNSEWG